MKNIINPAHPYDVQTNPEKKETGLSNIVFVCGLTSSGKDALLSKVATNSLEGKPVIYLTRFTNREIRNDERDIPGEVRPIPYLVQSVSSKTDLSENRSEYFGYFVREVNQYAFKRKELETILESSPNCLIVGVYSGPASEIKNFKKEVESMTYVVKAAKVSLILIGATTKDCLRRIDCRNLDRNSALRKKRYVVKDGPAMRELESNGFFDTTIDNSDRTPFNDSSRQLKEYLQSLLPSEDL